MAGATYYAESVSRATYGRQTRVPIVSAIEYWLDSAERLTILIRKMIENVLIESDEIEPWLKELDLLAKQYAKRVSVISVAPIQKKPDYYTLVITRKNGS